MAENLHRPRHGRKRISISVDWGTKFGVNASALREAVYAVGFDTAKIETYLRVLKARPSHRSPHRSEA